MKKYDVQFVGSIEHVGKSTWNQLCGTDYPFLRYEFLFALEKSGCTTSQSGWQPHHLVVIDISSHNQHIMAVMPLYIKTDSYGEYVFDWAWADAYQRYGYQYYPKLMTAIPFTPATGQRIGIIENSDNITATELSPIIVEAIKSEAIKLGASSWHCLFPENDLCELLKQEAISQRKGCQFHWLNQGYTSFDHFLETFNSRKRKTLKKERKKVQEQKIAIKRKMGTDITEDEWLMFYQFYHLTYFKRSGRQGYLNEEFFQRLATVMPEQIMMVIAYKEDGTMIAASLFFVGNSVLYGRYWGCLEEYDFLHFEACYYQGIEFAIENKLNKFDPGAQGEHKIQRGFTPVATWSNHWIARQDFKAAIDDFLEKEMMGVDHYISDCKNYLPFKKEP